MVPVAWAIVERVIDGHMYGFVELTGVPNVPETPG